MAAPLIPARPRFAVEHIGAAGEPVAGTTEAPSKVLPALVLLGLVGAAGYYLYSEATHEREIRRIQSRR